MISLKYIPDSKMASIAIEVKLVWFICISIMILFSHLIQVQVILFLALLCLAYYGGLNPGQIVSYLKLFWPVFLIVFLLHLFYHDGQVLFSIWLLKATAQGLRAGFLNLFRFINFLGAAICLLSWISPQEMAAKLFTGFGLSKRKFFQEITLIFFIAMRFMPVLIKEREIVILAMKARGADFGGGLVNRIKLNSKLMLPLFSRIIGQTDDVASALALKGYAGVYFTSPKTKLRRWDFYLLLIGIVLMVFAFFNG